MQSTRQVSPESPEKTSRQGRRTSKTDSVDQHGSAEFLEIARGSALHCEFQPLIVFDSRVFQIKSTWKKEKVKTLASFFAKKQQ